MKKKTILILSATAGAGHRRAAEALVETAQSLRLPVSVHHEDILDFTFPLFKKMYSDFYFSIVNKSPELWGYLYKRSEHPGAAKRKSSLVKMFDHFNYKKYIRLLHNLKPDAVLCTHFLPYLAISDQLCQSTWHLPYFSVTTDYDVHSLWADPSVKRYYVATDEVAWTLHSHGVKPEQVTVTGIPVMPQFAQQYAKATSRKKLGISSNIFTVMILSGGYGIGVIDELVPSVAKFLSQFERRQFQLLVVCGKNNQLYEKLKRHTFPKNISAILYPYIPFVDQLMDCSDVLVTKSGGLTVSEALAKHLPMIIFDPIPGQERRNADYVIERSAALSAINFSNLNFKLNDIIEHPSRLRTMKQNAKTIAKPFAAQAILENVVKII